MTREFRGSREFEANFVRGRRVRMRVFRPEADRDRHLCAGTNRTSDWRRVPFESDDRPRAWSWSGAVYAQPRACWR